jgi:DNA polymerase
MRLRPEAWVHTPAGFDHVLFFDTETFSPVPIRQGTHRYAEEAEVMVAAWSLDGGRLHVEDLTTDDGLACRMPSAALQALLGDPRVLVVMHKSDFDRTVIRHAWRIVLDVERCHDTMVRAMAHSLPGSLDKLCTIMGVPAYFAKVEGKEYINRFCKPAPKNAKVRRYTKLTHPKEWGEFLDYAGHDILSMRELFISLPRWNYSGRELELWHLDQRINDRGFLADVALARGAMAAVAVEKERLAHATNENTQGVVRKATERDWLLVHILGEYGVDLPDLKKDTLERRIEDPELPDALRQLLRLRLSSTTTSTAKYGAIMRAISADGRLRAALQFVGALRTGRWSGRLFQPQNLPRPDMLQPEIEAGIQSVIDGIWDLVLNDLMKLLSNALRGMIIASPGKKIISSDLKNIESVIAAWLAGEQWKLDAFASIFSELHLPEKQRTLPDMYVRAYASAFGVSHESVLEDKKAGGSQRQVGKVMELGLGYEGGVGAFISFAEVYRLKLEELAVAAYDAIPYEVRVQSEFMLGWRKKKRLTTFGLSDRAFVVIESFKRLWRDAHPQISTYWAELETAAIRAVQNPGVVVHARKLKFYRKGAWLRMILPSGRSLCYPEPQVNKGAAVCSACDGTGEVLGVCTECNGSGKASRSERKPRLSYAGVNQYNRQWSRIGTYGGKLFENACQAVARDVMGHNMPAIEAAGYEIVLTVHDDVITEALDEEAKSSDHLSALLATNPPWLTDCPLAADGFEAYRYKKD